MAISTSGFKIRSAKKKTAKRLADEYAKQQKRQKKRSGWSSVLGKGIGTLLGAGLAAIPGVGVLAQPLAKGVGSYLGKTIGHGLTGGMGAKLGGLKGDRFGFGKEEATTLREGLQAQIDAADPRKGLAGDILGSYAGALAGKTLGLADVKNALLPKAPFDPVSATKFNAAEHFGQAVTPERLPLVDMSSILNPQSGQTDFLQSLGPSITPSYGADSLLQAYPEHRQGGLVQKYQNGGVAQTPTIVDYFAMQNKTLGGSSTQSISDMLGKK